MCWAIAELWFSKNDHMWKRENAKLTRSVISGFGMCPQQAGAEIGAGPDLYTVCKVVNSHPDTACQFAKPVWVGPACQVSIIQVCIACQVVNMDGNALLAR